MNGAASRQTSGALPFRIRTSGKACALTMAKGPSDLLGLQVCLWDCGTVPYSALGIVRTQSVRLFLNHGSW